MQGRGVECAPDKLASSFSGFALVLCLLTSILPRLLIQAPFTQTNGSS